MKIIIARNIMRVRVFVAFSLNLFLLFLRLPGNTTVTTTTTTTTRRRRLGYNIPDTSPSHK